MEDKDRPSELKQYGIAFKIFAFACLTTLPIYFFGDSESFFYKRLEIAFSILTLLAIVAAIRVFYIWRKQNGRK